MPAKVELQQQPLQAQFLSWAGSIVAGGKETYVRQKRSEERHWYDAGCPWGLCYIEPPASVTGVACFLADCMPAACKRLPTKRPTLLLRACFMVFPLGTSPARCTLAHSTGPLSRGMAEWNIPLKTLQGHDLAGTERQHMVWWTRDHPPGQQQQWAGSDSLFLLGQWRCHHVGLMRSLWPTSKSRNVAGLTRAHFWMTDCCCCCCCCPHEWCPMLLGMMMMTMMARSIQQGRMPSDEGGRSVCRLAMGGTEGHAV